MDTATSDFATMAINVFCRVCNPKKEAKQIAPVEEISSKKNDFKDKGRLNLIIKSIKIIILRRVLKKYKSLVKWVIG